MPDHRILNVIYSWSAIGLGFVFGVAACVIVVFWLSGALEWLAHAFGG